MADIIDINISKGRQQGHCQSLPIYIEEGENGNLDIFIDFIHIGYISIRKGCIKMFKLEPNEIIALQKIGVAIIEIDGEYFVGSKEDE